MFFGSVQGGNIKQVAHEDPCGNILFSRNKCVILNKSFHHTSAVLNWVAMLVQLKIKTSKIYFIYFMS